MKKYIFSLALVLLAVVFSARGVFAGPPFVNLEGVGGVAFNPLAYLAEGDSDYKVGKVVIGKPRFGAWYVNLPNNGSKIDWTTFGVADTLFKRLEVSYGYEAVALTNGATYHKNNFGAKLLLLEDGAFDSKFVPAVSVGTIYKRTNKYVTTLRKSGQDWYLVATKTLGLFPLPVIVSGGILSSQEYVTGVLGSGNKRDVTGFANIDLVLPHNIVFGYEFKEGVRTGAVKNANYWDIHLAWLANKNLTVIAAYGNTGTTKSTRTGLGDGFVLSAQYAF